MRALFTKAVAGSMIVGAALALSACNKTEAPATNEAMTSEMNTTDAMASNDAMTSTDGAMSSNDAMMSSNDAMMSSNDAMATNAQ